MGINNLIGCGAAIAVVTMAEQGPGNNGPKTESLESGVNKPARKNGEEAKFDAGRHFDDYARELRSLANSLPPGYRIGVISVEAIDEAIRPWPKAILDFGGDKATIYAAATNALNPLRLKINEVNSQLQETVLANHSLPAVETSHYQSMNNQNQVSRYRVVYSQPQPNAFIIVGFAAVIVVICGVFVISVIDKF